MTNQNKKLVDQSAALTDFFESLMRDVDAYEEQENTEQPRVAKNYNVENTAESSNKVDHLTEVDTGSIELEKTQLEQLQDVSVESQTKTVEADTKIFESLPPVAPAPIVVAEVKPDIETTVVEAPVPEALPEPTEETEQASVTEELPEWCQHEFQAMLFKVAGLTLAVPLIDLNGVVECNLDEISAMPGHADFYFGLMKHLDKTVPLVDTARFVLPADKLSTLLGDDPSNRITRAVMIQDCQYGLACDEVNEVVTLSPDEVRWRTQRTQRRWLAGTVIEHMCALIDATAFAELLAERTPIQAFRE